MQVHLTTSYQRQIFHNKKKNIPSKALPTSSNPGIALKSSVFCLPQHQQSYQSTQYPGKQKRRKNFINKATKKKGERKSTCLSRGCLKSSASRLRKTTAVEVEVEVEVEAAAALQTGI